MSAFCFVQLLVLSIVAGLLGYYIEPHLWFNGAPTASVFAYGLIFGTLIGGLAVVLRSKGYASGDAGKDSGETVTLYVGNLPFSVKDDGLADIFASRCTVVSARVVTAGRGGRSKGYGFVDISASSAKKGLAMHGCEIEGRTIRVSMAKERNDD